MDNSSPARTTNVSVHMISMCTTALCTTHNSTEVMTIFPLIFIQSHHSLRSHLLEEKRHKTVCCIIIISIKNSNSFSKQAKFINRVHVYMTMHCSHSYLIQEILFNNVIIVFIFSLFYNTQTQSSLLHCNWKWNTAYGKSVLLMAFTSKLKTKWFQSRHCMTQSQRQWQRQNRNMQICSTPMNEHWCTAQEFRLQMCNWEAVYLTHN